MLSYILNSNRMPFLLSDEKKRVKSARGLTVSAYPNACLSKSARAKLH